MFRRLLIANRGEVAARILRTCQRLGIEAVVVASEADLGAPWLEGADRIVPLGPAPAAHSYLDADALIEVGVQHRCAAVHPGWGFLAENAVFARRCEAAGLTFVGPDPHHMSLMGDKARARETMKALGMPVIPGSDGPLSSLEEAREVFEQIAGPALLKAVSGGGGRGMRAVDHPQELREAWEQATAEATSAFGDGRLYLERRIVDGRHIEVQILADRFGVCLHLGERECSVQRRHQKVIEEAPSPALTPEERERFLPQVAQVVARSGYRNAGTIEMLRDASGELFFMEMNTRLQVEHPVTEQITGLDLVELQLRVAANQPLPLRQSEVRLRGHALELRLNAEDPAQDFRPSPGVVSELCWPQGEGIRVDTHLRSGDRIPPNYDSMIAKIIVSGPDRATTLERARQAVRATRVEGVPTNLALHGRLLRWQPFVSGAYHTRSLEQALPELLGGA
ncbi:MAG: ATP-grasp domain-containing protein [Deltaproteobacteria bacterium]|nr:MAG: ATP-grasp domain-containing protein [Deltaproteobacteria bacterium]